MGPLSGKERREDYAVSAKQVRENVAATLEQRRKQELHELKMKGEAAKYGITPPPVVGVSGPLAAPAPRPGSTDTVPAMLTPGEAVIPAAAAQDPANKGIIQNLVQQGREGGDALKNLLKHFIGEAATQSVPGKALTGRGRTIEDAEKASLGFNMGTTRVPGYSEGIASVPFPLARRR